MATVLGIPRKTTYQDLQTWPDDGRRYELYDGEVVVVPAPFPRHQITMLQLTDRLHSHVTRHGGIMLFSPIDIVFTDDNVLQPDIVVFTAARRHHVRLDEAIRVGPDVAVEVISAGTAARDRGRKLAMFERFGVQEYWIVDLVAERVEVRTLEQGRYALALSAGRGEELVSAVLAGLACRVDTLFPW